MAKLIKSTDIFETDDIFKGIRDSATKTIEELDKLNGEFSKTATELKKAIGGASFDSSKSIKEFTDNTSKANKLMMESVKIEELKQRVRVQSEKANEQLAKSEREKNKAQAESNKAMAEGEKLEQQRIRTARERAKAEKEAQREAEKKAKSEEKARKLAEAEASAYKQLEKATRELKNQSKELGAQMLKLESEGKRNTKEFREIERQYKATTQQAQILDQKLKGLDKSVGDNFRNVGNYKDAIRGLQSGLGQLGIAFGVGAVFQSATEKIIEFDQSVADLQAITGASGKDLEFYKQQANEMGVSVEGGASAVVEAYKLIGSAKPELLTNAEALNEVTKSAITLSQASGMTLPESATALTDAMNQFGADAKEAERYINVLANGAKFGAVEIPQVTDALLKFGAVAKTSNVSIEESTALIELLGEKGLKGAEAGTALRNVMLKLSAPDALPKEAQDRLTALGISFDQLNNDAIPFSERLSALKPLLEDNATLVKVFGMENAVSATSLISNIDRIKELESQMYTQGTAMEQATQRTNTLGHALMELKNEFFAMFTSMGSGSGSMQMFIDGLKFVAQNLGIIFSVLGKVVASWVLYRTTLASIQAYQFVMSGGLKELGKSLLANISLTNRASTAQRQLGTASVVAGDGVAKAGRALGAIPWMVLIGFLIEMATKWYDVASGTAEARRQEDLFNESKKVGQEISDKAVADEMDNVKERLRLLDLESRKRIANGESEKKVNEERAMLEQQIHEDAKRQFNEKIYWAEQWLKRLESDRAKIPSTIQKIGAKGEVFTIANPELETTGRQLEQSIANQREAINNMKNSQKTFQDALDESQVKLIETNAREKDYSVTIADNTGKVKGNVKAHHELKTALKEVDDYLERTIQLEQQLTEIRQKRQLAQMDQTIEGDIANAVKLASEKGEVVVAKEGEMYDEIEKKIIERFELEKTFIQQRAEISVTELRNQFARETQLEKDKLKDERDELLKQDGLTKTQREAIEKSYQTRLGELAVEQTQREKDLNTEIAIITEKSVDDQVKLEQDKNKDIKTYNDQLNEALKTNAETTNNAIKKGNDDVLKSEKEKYKTIDEFVKASTDFFIQQSEKKVAQIDKELTKANQQYDTLKTLAENGNINAQQSLAEQQKAITDLEKRKEKELKRQQRIKLAQSVFTTYASKVESGSKNALAETIRDTTLLTQFISSLPTFESGIEDTGKNGHGIDGKGGFLSVLHPNERVVPKSLNEQIGGMSNEQLSKIAWEYQNGKIVRDGDAIASPMETMILVQKIDELNQTIKNKPETNIELGAITQSMMEIVQKTKAGNTTTYNRYRVKK
jgi:TP901 family phage tail tape measure protein